MSAGPPSAPDAPRTRPGGRSARITRQVHAAVMAALMEHGLHGIAIEDVAARADVNKTTIYRRWGTRERLLADALAAQSGDRIPIPDTGGLESDLVAFALRVRDALVAPASRALMSALAAGRHDEELERTGQRFWQQRLAAVRPVVQRAVSRGELPADVEADELVARVVGPIWFAVFGPGLDVSDDFVAETVATVLAGCRR